MKVIIIRNYKSYCLPDRDQKYDQEKKKKISIDDESTKKGNPTKLIVMSIKRFPEHNTLNRNSLK